MALVAKTSGDGQIAAAYAQYRSKRIAWLFRAAAIKELPHDTIGKVIEFLTLSMRGFLETVFPPISPAILDAQRFAPRKWLFSADARGHGLVITVAEDYVPGVSLGKFRARRLYPDTMDTTRSLVRAGHGLTRDRHFVWTLRTSFEWALNKGVEKIDVASGSNC